MTPDELTSASFAKYAPEARSTAIAYLPELRALPTAVLVSFLSEIIHLDRKFPAERKQLEARLEGLRKMPHAEAQLVFKRFRAISLPGQLSRLDWLNAPTTGMEYLTPHLWSSGQIDAYRAAAKALVDAISKYAPPAANMPQRLVIVTTTSELRSPGYPIFEKLRKSGLFATQVADPKTSDWMTDLVGHRSSTQPGTYAHWVLDTAGRKQVAGSITYLSYTAAEPVRRSVLNEMQRAVRTGAGPEALRSRLTSLSAEESRAAEVSSDPVLQYFILNLFVDGSGTQIYSTSFAQWSAREILRRAQPTTLAVNIGTRVRQRSLNEFLAGERESNEPDPGGSLIDADLVAYYTWLEMAELPDGGKAIFLAWFPGHHSAFLSGPGVPKNVMTKDSMTVDRLLDIAQEVA
jgi:hypothetical protein